MTRRGWKRVYDLAERAVPADLLAREPSDEECFDYLVAAAGRALGVATRRDIADYYRLTMSAVSVPSRHRLFQDAIAGSGLVETRVDGWDEPAFVHAPALKRRPGESVRTTLLSPFDSLIWYRPRALRLWGLEFLLEAYKPKHQRVHGYFSMPLLADGRIVGRVDPARDGGTLLVRNFALDAPAHAHALVEALREAAGWVGCTDVRIEGGPPRLANEARRLL